MGSREWYRPRAVHGTRPFKRAFEQLHRVSGYGITLARVGACPRYWHVGLWTCALAALIACSWPVTARAVNSVYVESKTVLAGATNVPVRIRVTNDITLQELRVPLELRSQSGGAFPYAFFMTYSERLAGSAMSEQSVRRHYEDRDLDTCYSLWSTVGSKDTIENSPEGIMFLRSGATPPLDPGADSVGSMILTLDIGATPGTFVIDTTCVSPETYFGFNQGVPVEFTSGLITVVTSAPDSIFVDTTGSDNLGLGTRGSPYLTIQHAISQVSTSGTVIMVGPGVYRGPIHYPSLQTLSIVASEGPFKTAIVGDSTTSVVVMDAGDPLQQILNGFTIRDNHLTGGASLNAAGITVKSPTIGSIYNCIIRDNSLESGAGAGIEYDGTGGTIANCWIVNNTSNAVGFGVGGVYLAPFANITMVNNTIALNTSTASNGASGVFLASVTATVSRAAILGGEWAASAHHPAIASAIAATAFHNNIVAFNRREYGVFAANPDEYPIAFKNCVVYDNGKFQAGIFDNAVSYSEDPAFRDTIAGDYHITCASSARNHGNGSYLPPRITTDIDGQNRYGPAPPIMDIGADEFFDDHKVVSFAVSDTVGCAPLLVQFTSNSEICIDEGLRWDFGDGFTFTNIANPLHVYDTAGIYSVKLVAEGLYADSLIRTDLIRVIDPPVSDFTADTLLGCQTLTVGFEASTVAGIDLFTWNFGDGDTTVGPVAEHTYEGPGTYSVSLYATNDCGTDTTTMEDYITVASPIVANFSASPQFGCDQLEVTFIATASAEVDEFAWDFGDEEFDMEFAEVGDTVTHLYTQAGLYTVRLFATNGCGTVTVVHEDLIKISDKPQVFIDSDYDPQNPECNPTTVSFTFFPQDGIDSVAWQFGDDGTSKQFEPVHTYDIGGRTYSVRMVAYGACGADTVVRNQYIRVLKRPTAVLAATPNVGCVNTVPVNFSATIDGDVDSTRWYFGDGTSAPGAILPHTYSGLGTYQPSFKMWHQCGSDSAVLGGTVTATTTPVAAFSVSATSGYEPFEVSFTDQSTNTPIAWHWDFGDGDTAVEQNPVHSFGPGLYTVALEASNTCGASTLTKDDHILVGGFSFTVDSTGESGDTILYSVTVSAEVQAYDHDVNLSGALVGTPRRGKVTFLFSPASGMPPFTATAKAVPSVDLATDNYSLRFTVADPARISKDVTRSLNFTGSPIIAITPADSVRMDSTEVGMSTSKSINIKNVAPAASGISLVVQAPSVSGPAYHMVGSGGTLQPGQQLIWGIQFTPLQKAEYTGTVHVVSDDPALPQIEYIARGRGIGNQITPVLVATLPDSTIETKIDDSVRVTFSKFMETIPSDTVLIVRSLASGDTLPGQRRWVTAKILQFRPFELFPPDDIIAVTIRAVVTDIDGNFFDGNGDGFEQFSPEDDYTFTFPTGPGVYPGDTDSDGKVNEGDVIPIGRYWGLEGPRRIYSRPGFTIQAATAWDPREATYADADGDGTIDELDICPIADYFDREVVLPKASVDAWMAEAAGWSGNIVGAMLEALDQCDKASAAGKAILGEFLRSLSRPDPVPTTYSLSQNYPNPFNPTTVIEYTLGKATDVRLEIYNLQGQLVRTLDNGHLAAGRHFKVWDGRNGAGQDVASGVYFYRLITPNFQYARKMVLVR